MYLTTRAVAGYTPGLELEAKEMIHDLYIRSKAGAVPVNPQRFASHASLNNVLTLVFNFRTESIDDKLVSDSLRLSREFMCVPLFPPLIYHTLFATCADVCVYGREGTPPVQSRISSVSSHCCRSSLTTWRPGGGLSAASWWRSAVQ